MYLKDGNVITNLDNTPSCYTNFLKFLFRIYVSRNERDLGDLEFYKIIEKLNKAPNCLIEHFSPQLMGFYITHSEYFR
jgi:hypothetical protein